jgi:uncharacterized protein (TIGR01244 family)
MRNPTIGAWLLAAAAALAPSCAASDNGTGEGAETPPPAARGTTDATPLDIENFVVIEEGVAGAGQPTREAIAAAKAQGYRTLVSLRPAEGKVDLERQAALEAGLVYVNIPLADQDFGFEPADRLAEVLERPNVRPVLIHCRNGNRTGAVWALYVAKHRGEDVEEALAQGEAAGMRHPRLRKLIERRLRSR